MTSGDAVATSAYSSPHDLLRLFPDFLGARRRGFPGLPALLADAGLSRPAFFMLVRVTEQAPGAATADSLRPGAPYATRDDHLPWLAEGITAGLLACDAAGRYTLTAAGEALVVRLEREATAWLAGLHVLPADELARLADGFTAIVAGLDAEAGGPGSHLMRSRRLAALVPEASADPLVRLERAILDLWMARDDAHIGAWRMAHFDGPQLDVLTQLWRGDVDSLEGLQEALQATQAPEDVAATVDELLEQGYLEVRHGALQPARAGYNVREAIEADTDDLYFRQWPPLDPAAIGWLHDALTRLSAALPEPTA